MILEPFRAAHMTEIDLQPAQAYLRPFLTQSELDQLEAAGPAYTVRAAKGEIAMCAGFVTAPAGSYLWSFISVMGRTRLIALRDVARRFLDVAPRLPVLATVESDFPAGQQWVAMLGFTYERAVPQLGPDGRDHHIYSWGRA